MVCGLETRKFGSGECWLCGAEGHLGGWAGFSTDAVCCGLARLFVTFGGSSGIVFSVARYHIRACFSTDGALVRLFVTEPSESLD